MAHDKLRQMDISVNKLVFQSANAIFDQIVNRLRDEHNNHLVPEQESNVNHPR